MGTPPVDEIAEKLLAYFAERFPHSPRPGMTTDLKSEYSFSSSAWAHLAVDLNRLDWMLEQDIQLTPTDMNMVRTVGQLSSAIKAKWPPKKAGGQKRPPRKRPKATA